MSEIDVNEAIARMETLISFSESTGDWPKVVAALKTIIAAYRSLEAEMAKTQGLARQVVAAPDHIADTMKMVDDLRLLKIYMYHVIAMEGVDYIRFVENENLTAADVEILNAISAEIVVEIKAEASHD